MMTMIYETALALWCGIMAAPFNADLEERVLFRFNSTESARQWRPVNDSVMGGLSSGQFRINRFKNLEFFGNLSLQNNGGFASIRAGGDHLAMAAGDTIVLRVRGDGRQYNFNLYTQRNLGGYSYRQPFPTKRGEWIDVKMPIGQFMATWRGRQYPNEALDPGKVAGMGILLGDKKPGPFQLEVEWIKVVTDKP